MAASGGDGYGVSATTGVEESHADNPRHQLRISPPLYKGGSEKYAGWKKDFIRSVRFLDLSEVFSGQDVLPDCSSKSRSALSREGCDQHYLSRVALSV